MVQVGPKHRCSQFEHHVWLFCRDTKWKGNFKHRSWSPHLRDSPKPWLFSWPFSACKPHPPWSTCVRTNQKTCINVINTYTSLLIYQHQHQILMQTCKTVGLFVCFPPELLFLRAHNPFARQPIRAECNTQKRKKWEWIFQALNPPIICISVTFWSSEIGIPLMGKIGCTQKI